MADQAAGAEEPQQQQQGGLLSTLMRFAMMYYLYSTFFKSKGAAPAAGGGGEAGVAPSGHSCLFQADTCMSMQVYLSRDEVFLSFGDEDALIWEEHDICLNDADANERHSQVVVPLDAELQNNGTLFAHTFFFVPGYNPDPASQAYHPHRVIAGTKPIITYRPAPKVKKLRSLVGGTVAEEPEMEPEAEIADSIAEADAENEARWISYWNQNMTFHLVNDFTRYSRGSIPPQMLEQMTFDESGRYYPTLYFNDFWILVEDLVPVNDTLSELPIYLDYTPLSLFKWQMYVQMGQSFQMQTTMGSSESEIDEFKRMLKDTNVYLLALTFVVTILHMVFDFLAFRSDIHFWRKNDSMEGLSLRTIMLNTGCQVVIFLYLLDNETSWMVTLSSGIGCLIEFWKITRAVDFTVDRSGGGFRIHWEKKASYTQTETEEYDAQASKYLYMALMPLVIGYAIYSLLYEEHKSWYSFVLGSLTGAIYVGGFIMMTPQLFINYKMKSVAHMPWKAFVFRALNTFIDDLFAFIIKMPTLHRLACFRDDIIFLIFLYQRYIYPVDPNRKNEHGISKKDIEEHERQKALKASGASDDQPEAKADGADEANEEDQEDKDTKAKDGDDQSEVSAKAIKQD